MEFATCCFHLVTSSQQNIFPVYPCMLCNPLNDDGRLIMPAPGAVGTRAGQTGVEVYT